MSALQEPYHTLESHYLLQSRWRNMREDRIDIGDGREITYSYVETPRAVFIVPLRTMATSFSSANTGIRCAIG